MEDLSAATIRTYLDQLCRQHPDRHVGGPGNHAANELFLRTAARFGFQVEVSELPCLRWIAGRSRLVTGAGSLDLHTGPYSLPCAGSGPLRGVSTVEELERGGLEGHVVVMHGALARQQLMPKSFVFYNPPEHRRIVAALEAARPLAVVACTGQNPEMAGGVSPFPLIEDGDFDVPTAFLSELAAADLLRHAGETVQLIIDSRREPCTSPQCVARKGGAGGKRIVFFAHIDSKHGTPGALDNASGVSALLGLMQLLEGYRGPHALEIVPLNGEDDYAIPGQMHWLAANEGRMGDIVLGLNVDGAGFCGHKIAVSYYGCPPVLRAVVDQAVRRFDFVEGAPWPQGDHSLLAFHGVPAVALTSENAFFINTTVAHTDRDVPDLVDAAQIVTVSRFLAEVAARLPS